MKHATNRTLQIVRTIRAPCDLVYAAWTDLVLAKQWWGSDGVKTHELVIDAREGGDFRWGFTTTEGERLATQGEFREVLPGKKLVFTWEPEDVSHENDEDDEERIESVVTVEFEEKDDATELHLTQADLPNEEFGGDHDDGWNSALDKLERVLARRRPDSPESRAPLHSGQDSDSPRS